MGFCTEIKHADREEYDKALSAFENAAKIDPNDAIVFFLLGHSYKNLEEYEKAIIDYSQAIDLDQQLAEGYLNRGWAYYKLGKGTEAIADAEMAISLTDDQAIIYNAQEMIKQITETY